MRWVEGYNTDLTLRIVCGSSLIFLRVLARLGRSREERVGACCCC